MADYIEVNNYSDLGKIGISRKTLQTKTSKAVATVNGASIRKDKTKRKPILSLFHVTKPISVILRKDGLAEIKIEVNVKSGENVADICLQLQKEVVQGIEIMCETVPVKVGVKVVGLI